jgi:PAS domain S-box-containing protein
MFDKFSSRSYRKSLAALFGLFSALVVIIGIVAYRTSAKFIEYNQLQNKSLETLKKLEAVRGRLVDAETGQRGFIITGDDRYLRPYNAAVSELDREFSELQQLVKNNSSHMRRLQVLKPLVDEKLRGIRERIGIYREKGIEAAALEVRRGRGLIVMEKIREIIGDMEDEERNILIQSIAETRASGKYTLFVLVFGSSVSILIVVTANIFLYGELKKREKAEEALRISERSYREIFNSTSDALVIHDENGTISDLNEQACTLFGVDRATVLESSIGQFSLGEPPYSQAEAAEKLHGAFYEGPQVFEWRSRRVNGEVFWSEVALRASEILGKRIVIASVRNINNRKQAEESLKKREAELESIFRAAPIGIGVVVNRTIKAANKRWCEMTGYSLAELLDKDARMLYPDDADYEYVGTEKYRQIVGKGTGIVETRWLRKDGNIIHILLSSAPLDPSDWSKGITATVLDISDRKKAEEALLKAHAELEQRVEERTAELRESEEKFRTLAETSLAGIYIYRGEKLLYVNPRIEAITGYCREELLRMRYWDFMHPDFKDLIRERGQARQRGEPVPTQYELKVVKKTGEERWVAIYSAPFQIAGELAILGTAFDVTERKEIEEQLFVYQNRLRTLAAELTLTEEHERRKIAADLHDHVIQMLALCRIKVDALKDSLGNLQVKAVDEIGGFIDEAINYSRSLISELSPQILYTLGFESAVGWLGEEILGKNSIQFHYRNEGQPLLLKDNARIILFLAVRELLFNIVKHSKAHEARVTIQKNGNTVHVNVEDDGVGFDVSGGVTPIGGGGFGLFNIREQLYSIGGQLIVDSRQGEGTRIRLTAPLG